ncbi:hypothetical protein D917_08033 [Trichinella nativa]|uniref:Uncharacterized protein n=1 Tax=Trichinella nativa TaxID=6335 RepID=A0A1Y3EMT1_9BILA|nr:hypothetical protein D917_08033 [Trichinella nativa]
MTATTHQQIGHKRRKLECAADSFASIANMPSSQNCRSMWLVVVIEKLFTSLHTAKTPFNNQPDANVGSFG